MHLSTFDKLALTLLLGASFASQQWEGCLLVQGCSESNPMLLTPICCSMLFTVFENWHVRIKSPLFSMVQAFVLDTHILETDFEFPSGANLIDKEEMSPRSTFRKSSSTGSRQRHFSPPLVTSNKHGNRLSAVERYFLCNSLFCSLCSPRPDWLNLALYLISGVV